MQIEFTDRYGGNPPSWLRACLECEAMGCYPTGSGEDDPFVTCPHCGGTAKIPWWRTLVRLPRWLWQGLRFLWTTRDPEMHPPEWGWGKRLRVRFACAFLADLGLWRP